MSYAIQVDEVTDAARAQLLAAGDPARTEGLKVEFGGEATEAMTEIERQGSSGRVLLALLVLAIAFGRW